MKNIPKGWEAKLVAEDGDFYSHTQYKLNKGGYVIVVDEEENEYGGRLDFRLEPANNLVSDEKSPYKDQYRKRKSLPVVRFFATGMNLEEIEKHAEALWKVVSEFHIWAM